MNYELTPLTGKDPTDEAVERALKGEIGKPKRDNITREVVGMDEDAIDDRKPERPLTKREQAALKFAMAQGGDGTAIQAFRVKNYGLNMLSRLVAWGMFDVKDNPPRLKLTAQGAQQAAAATPLLADVEPTPSSRPRELGTIPNPDN